MYFTGITTKIPIIYIAKLLIRYEADLGLDYFRIFFKKRLKHRERFRCITSCLQSFPEVFVQINRNYFSSEFHRKKNKVFVHKVSNRQSHNSLAHKLQTRRSVKIREVFIRCAIEMLYRFENAVFEKLRSMIFVFPCRDCWNFLHDAGLHARYFLETQKLQQRFDGKSYTAISSLANRVLTSLISSANR